MAHLLLKQRVVINLKFLDDYIETQGPIFIVEPGLLSSIISA